MLRKNSLKGLEILVTQRIGLLILDLGLPDMDGLEVY
jgi:two-component system KDP operon response regulator KdpE